MSPFRDAPQVELGPLSVGLAEASSRAMIALPSGGRVVAIQKTRVAYVVGALGSAGLCAVGVAALVAWSTSWTPESAPGLGLCVLGVVAGGLSLAAIFRATDRAAGTRTQSGLLVGSGARRILAKLGRLAREAERSPATFTGRRLTELRQTILAASHPEMARWVPEDVRGRAELLLGRAWALSGGPAWAGEAWRRRAVKEMLEGAARRMSEPAGAEADLRALEQAPLSGRGRRVEASPLPRARVALAAEPLLDDADEERDRAVARR